MKLADIRSMSEYLTRYGRALGRKAADSLRPLHVPGRDPDPSFEDIVLFNPEREPFEPQKHVIEAASLMLAAQGGGFVVGEMGTGKTIIGMLSVHRYHAKKGRAAYRAAVLCPDHLIDKWEREISETIPRARIRKFENWKDFLNLLGLRSSTKGKNGKALWKAPIGPEWYIVGRNQAKWAPSWAGICEPPPGSREKRVGSLSAKPIVVSKELVTDELGRATYDKSGRPIYKNVIARAVVCPSCGKQAVDKDGAPLSNNEIEKNRLFCEGIYLRETHPDAGKSQDGRVDGSHKCLRAYHRGSHLTDTDPALANAESSWKDGKEVTFCNRKYVVTECGEPLWQWTKKPYRWPPAKIIQKKMRGFFNDLIVDEVHEQKSEDSAQANAAGALMGASDRVLCLTGTLIGGYASDLFALMVRMGFVSIFEEGFKWRGTAEFAEQYGSMDRIVSTTIGGAEAPKTTGRKGQVSIRKQTSHPKTTFREAPGVMPQLFGAHMIGRSLFISLEEMADELPPMIEYVSGKIKPEPPPQGAIDEAQARIDRMIACGTGTSDPELKSAVSAHSELLHQKLYSDNWFQVGCDLDADQEVEYKRVHGYLEAAAKELLKFGSMKLLSTFLHTTMAYPDQPYGWKHSAEVSLAIEKAIKEGCDVDKSLIGTVGYWDKNKTDLKEWFGVVSPADLDRETIRPKERCLIDICAHHKKQGNQVWVYCQMTDKRNIQPRLQKILQDAGLRVGILRSTDVDLKDREKWIIENGKDYDVLISHPKLVSTGLDLFDKGGSHNFNVLVFYQTGYSLFDTRQASRRSWRIGQKRACFVYYLYYKWTMQHRAMQLNSRKMAAAMAVDGEFSADGLAGLSDEGGGAMSLVKSLCDNMSDEDMQRNWGKVRGGGMTFKKKAHKAGSVFIDDDVIDALWGDDDDTPKPGQTSPFDKFDPGVQLAAEAMFDDDAEFFDDEVHAAISSATPTPSPETPAQVKGVPANERLAALLDKLFDDD